MATLEGRLTDPDYRNWVKSALCLQYTRDGLVTFTGLKSLELNQNIIHQLQLNGNPSVYNLCPTIGYDMRRKSITCCGNCNDILNEVMKYRPGRLDLNLKNADPTKLLHQHWQCSKMFMNPGQDVNSTGPKETDISALLNFVDHCTVPRGFVNNPDLLKQVRDTRNRVLHTSSMKITDDDFQNVITPLLIDLLSDPGFLQTDPEAKEAVEKIRDVKKADFIITTDNERKVLDTLTNEIRRLYYLTNDEMKKLNDRIDRLNKDLSSFESSNKADMNVLRDDIKKNDTEVSEIRRMQEALRKLVEQSKDMHDDIHQHLADIQEQTKSTADSHKALQVRVEGIQRQLIAMQNQIVENKQQTYNLSEEQIKLKATQTEDRQEIRQEISIIYQRQDNLSKAFGEIQSKSEPYFPLEEDKSELRQFLIKGYEQKLDVTLLPDWEPLHISDTFTPSILVDDQEGEKRTYWEKTLINIGPMSHRLAALPGKDVTGKNKLGSYKEIFYRKDELQKRVFLLGEAGAGKTTFSKHLVNLWCETTTQPQFSDVTVIKGFRYFFYVSCRFAKEGDIIADMIKDQIFGDDKLKDVATYMLEHYPECCLIVLDGADEWKGSATGRRGDIVGLPGMQGVEHCVILITSRPWRFHSLPTRSRSIFRRLQINGIKDVRVLAYRILQQLDDPDPKDSSYEFLRQIREKNMSELMKIPLILIIALGGWVDDKSLHRSITVNYINMIHSLISRSKGQAGWSDPESKLKRLIPNLDKLEAKWELQSNKLPDVFWRYESIQRFAGLFLSLGEIAFDLLLEKQEHTLVFSNQVLKKYQSVNDESVNVCLALGILSKTETTTRGLRKLESYAFCHKTFQEFFAALWLASKYSNEKSKLYKCLKSYRDLMSYEESIIFLCGFDPEAGKRFWMFVAEEVEIVEEDDKDVLDFERKRKVTEEVEIMEEDDKDVLDFERKRKVAEEVEIMEEDDKDVLDFERKRKVTEEVEIMEEDDKDVLDIERKRKVAEEVEIMEEDDKDVLDFERKRKVAEEVEIMEEDDKDVLDFERKRKVAEEVEIMEEDDKDVLDIERKRKVAEEVEIMEEDDKDVLDFERKRKVAEEVEIMEEDDKDVLDIERKRKVAEEVEIIEEADKDVLDFERKRKVTEEVEIMEEDDKDVLDIERKRKVAEEVEIMEEDDKDVLDFERKRKVAEEVEIIEEADKDVLDFERKRKVTEEVEIIEEADKDVLDFERKRKVAEEVEIVEEDDKDVLDFERKRKVAEEVEIVEEDDKDVLDFERKRKVAEEVEIVEEADKDVLDFERLVKDVRDVTKDLTYLVRMVRDLQVKNVQDLVCKCMKEHGFDQKDQTLDQIYFCIPHIVIVNNTSNEDIMLLCHVMEEYPCNVKSLYVDNCQSQLQTLCSGLQSLKLSHLPIVSEHIDSEHSDSEHRHSVEYLPSVSKQRDSEPSDSEPSDSEHSHSLSSPVLDLQKHDKLETLRLLYLSIEGLLLPVEGARITSLTLYKVTLTHHGCELLSESLSSCSHLEDLVLIGVRCREHSDSSCIPVLDLQKHDKLKTLALRWLSIEGLLLPVEEARITWLKLDDVTMTHHGCEQLSGFFSSRPELRNPGLISVKCREHKDSPCQAIKDIRNLK